MLPSVQKTLDLAVRQLIAGLGTNLYSCCVYGSSVRGNAVEGKSDINLLVVLNDSNTEAHAAVGRALDGMNVIEPFVLAKRGFERSVRAFSPKFASIQRNYRVLHGADPLASIRIDPAMERFLCKQAVRNLRLRLVYAFIKRSYNKSYDRFVASNVTPLFIHASEILRLNGTQIPTAFETRIPILKRFFQIEDSVLEDLLELKRSPVRFNEKETVVWHSRIFPLVDSMLIWIETHWNTAPPS